MSKKEKRRREKSPACVTKILGKCICPHTTALQCHTWRSPLHSLLQIRLQKADFLATNLTTVTGGPETRPFLSYQLKVLIGLKIQIQIKYYLSIANVVYSVLGMYALATFQDIIVAFEFFFEKSNSLFSGNELKILNKLSMATP